MAASGTTRWLLVDGHGYAYRGFHAIRELASPTGEPTNALYGFVQAVEKLWNDLQPNCLVVVWDGGLAEQRTTLWPAYKAQRPPMPERLKPQLDEMTAWVRARGATSLCAPGIEADDWIAALAKAAQAQGACVIIASSDKDFMQLVGPGVGLVNPNDKSGAIWDAAAVVAKAGVSPAQIVDWLSLVGDTVDNLPGVPGVGPKTATTLLRQFGSCESLFARLAEVESAKLRASLAAAADCVRRNQRLIRLETELPLPLPPEGLGLRPADEDELTRLYARWGFHRRLRDGPRRANPQPDLFGVVDEPRPGKKLA